MGKGMWHTWGRNLKGKGSYEDLGMDKIIILKWIIKGVTGIHLAQERDQWQPVVNSVINRQFP
jgi:hypothetical protein